MSQIDDPADVDGSPTEPEGGRSSAPAGSNGSNGSGGSTAPPTPEDKPRASRRAPAKKSTGRKATARSKKAAPGEKPEPVKAEGSPRTRATPARRRAPAGRRGSTATAEAVGTGTDAPPEVTAEQAPTDGIEVVDDPHVLEGQAPPAPADATAPAEAEEESKTEPEVEAAATVPEDEIPAAHAGVPVDEVPAAAPVVTLDPLPEPRASVDVDPVPDPPSELPVDTVPAAAPPGARPGPGDAAPPAPDPVVVDPVLTEPRSRRPWTGRWKPDADSGLVARQDEPTGDEPPDAGGDRSRDDPGYLSTLPPPPAGAPAAPGRGLGERLTPVRATVAAGTVRLSAWAAGAVAGRRRHEDGTRGRVDAPAVPAPVAGAAVEVGPGAAAEAGAGDGSAVDRPDAAYLATLPPPPAAPVPGAPIDVVDLGLLDDWSLPDWSVSGAAGGPAAVPLSVSGVNSDRAVIAPAGEPAPPAGPSPIAGPPSIVEPRPTGEVTTLDAPGTLDEATAEYFLPLVDEPSAEPPGPAEPEPGPEPPAPVVDDGPVPGLEPQPGWVRSRHQRRKEWRRVERARRYAARKSVRFPVVTRSILLWMLIFGLMGVTAGGTSAVFWTHFNTEIAQLRDETQDFDKRSDAAEARIEGMRNEAVDEIDRRMKELAPALAEPRTVQAGKLLSPYVWFVSTLDENGVASVGTAFSVATDARSTWLLTSFNVVKAGTVRPAPPMKLRKDPEEVDAELVSWDAANDLALIRMDRPSQPTLEWAAEDVQAKLVGNRLYVVTGFGGAGATLNSAMTIDQNTRGLLHDGRIGTAAQGGPVVTTDGKVVGVASLVYQPLGFDPGELHYAPSIRRACDVLLTCVMEAHRVRPAPR